MRKQKGSSKTNSTICAPPSKSAMIRAIALSLLSDGKTVIKNPSYCMDAVIGLNIARSLGADIVRGNNYITIQGNQGLNKKPIKDSLLNCGESGLCIRMFSSIVALLDKEFVLNGEGTLALRPVGMVEELTKLGACCSTNNGFVPVTVKGPITSGKYTIDGSQSSQFLTGLMIALPLCSGDSEIYISNLKSRPYLKMTVEMLREFGVECGFNESLDMFYIKGNQRYKAREYTIEGDWSGAAFMLVAGAISGSVTVTGLNINSSQADKVILDILEMAGASLSIEEDSITVKKNRLNSFEFNAEDSPDIVPPAVALAAHCKGKTYISGIKRLRIKESNRLDALIKGFSRMGIKISVENETLIIEGGRLKDAMVDPYNDHRIAMACAVCGVTKEAEIIVKNPQCVFKSYPSFFYDLSRLVESR